MIKPETRAELAAAWEERGLGIPSFYAAAPERQAEFIQQRMAQRMRLAECGYMSAVDEALISNQLGTVDSFATPQEALAALVQWEISVAIDPTVNGGYRLAKDAVDHSPDAGKMADDGWVEWRGGECPIANDTDTWVRLRDDSESEMCLAGGFQWAHLGDDTDIVAYKIDRLGAGTVPPVAGQSFRMRSGEAIFLSDIWSYVWDSSGKDRFDNRDDLIERIQEPAK